MVRKKRTYGLRTNDHLIPILKNYFRIDKEIRYPAVLFFQEHKGSVADYLVVGLDETKIEESFWKLQQYIQGAVGELEKN